MRSSLRRIWMGVYLNSLRTLITAWPLSRFRMYLKLLLSWLSGERTYQFLKLRLNNSPLTYTQLYALSALLKYFKYWSTSKPYTAFCLLTFKFEWQTFDKGCKTALVVVHKIIWKPIHQHYLLLYEKRPWEINYNFQENLERLRLSGVRRLFIRLEMKSIR